MKKYNIMQNVGTCKYLVSYHDGVKRYEDGSNYYDIEIFKNKRKMNSFISKLKKEGYVYGNG